ncbi:MAG: DUF393 domain-containing protein [Anaerolineales bacterium]|nr:DUF393 domain-containing protein [Chloroflexota bacterium]MBL6981503.1 DUF393 domain-containing protein [Anaerolineales bacterium]
MKVIYDGDCPVCASLKEFAEKRNDRESIKFIPYQAKNLAKHAPGLTQEQTSQALYAISDRGIQSRGARAVFEVMKQLPGFWGAAGRILSLPPFVWLANPVYTLVAKHRHKISNRL